MADSILSSGTRVGKNGVFLNDGTGTKFQELAIGSEKGAVYGMAIGDFNADDTLDIVQARSDAPNTILFCSESNKPDQIDRETRDIVGWQVHVARKLLETEADDTAKQRSSAWKRCSARSCELFRRLP